MASLTTGLRLRKPSANDTVNVAADIAENMDLIDAAFGDPEDRGYDIILLAGQSNMQGRDNTYSLTTTDPSDHRIWQFPNVGPYFDQIILATEPLQHHDAMTWSTPGVGPGLEFARWYLGVVPGSRRVLLVPVAHGGTGFSTTSTNPAPATYLWNDDFTGGTWDPEGPGTINLAENAVDQANKAIEAAGEGSRIAAILWVQGESDAPRRTGAEYAVLLDDLIDYFRQNIDGATDVPFVLGQMTPEIIASDATYQAINAVHIATPSRKERTGFAYGVEGNTISGQPIHYDATGAKLLGKALVGAFRRARLNIEGSDPVAPASVTLTQDGTSLVITHPQTMGRATDYRYEYKLAAATSWTTLADGTSLVPEATITGLTLGSTYDVRVATVNEQGTSDYIESSFTMATVPGQVTGLAAGTATQSTVPLSWNVVSGALTYLVEYKEDASGTWLEWDEVDDLSETVRNLAYLTDYDFRVTAINGAGAGTPSAIVTVATANVAYMGTTVPVAPARACSAARQLVSAYSGPALEVRRSSDNTAQDIDLVDGLLDIASLMSFVGANSGYVRTIYDQSGNGLDLVQSTAAAQARIVNAGVLETLGGWPTMVFSGAQYYTDTDPGAYAAGSATLMAVFNVPVPTSSVRMFTETSTSSNSPLYSLADNIGSPWLSASERITNDAGTNLRGGSAFLSPPAFNGADHQYTFVDSGTQVLKYLDTTLITPNVTYARSGTLTATNFSVGAMVRAAVTNTFPSGSLSEFVVWYSALSTPNRTAGQTNQKDFYGTP